MALLHVCFAPADRAWVLGRLLPGLGLADGEVHTREHDALGAPQLDELRKAVEASRYTVLIASRAAAFDALAQAATGLAQYATFEGEAPRLLVLTRDFAPGAPEEAERLPLGLRALVKLDGSDDDALGAAIARLRTLLGRTDAPARTDPPPCPYPGLRSFDQRDRDLFFGRTADQDEVRARLAGGRTRILVVGPSGSGKSSLIHAGVLPDLNRGKVLVRVVPRGGALLAALRAELDQLEVPGLGAALDRYLDDVAEATATAVAAARTRLRALIPPDARRRVLVVDPLEEIFVATEAAERDRTLDLLAGLWHLPWCTVILCMRADFYEQAMEARCWCDLSGAQLEVSPLTEDGLRDAIVRPAEKAGVYLDDALVERLVHEVDRDRASLPLPLLQVTLTQLWERMTSRHLSLASYQRLAVGSSRGLSAALAIQADAVIDDLLDPGARVLAQRVFLDLVHLEPGRTTRRRRTVDELHRLGAEPGQLERVLAHLVAGRLLVADEQAGGATIDLVHEALIRGWPRFADWIAAQRDALVKSRRIEAWADRGLLDEGDTAEAAEWIASAPARLVGVSGALRTLVEASQAAHERRRRDKEEMIARLEDEQRKTTASVAAATKLATDIVLEIDTRLRDLAGAHPARSTLLDRALALLDTLRALAPTGVVELRTATMIRMLRGDTLLERGQAEAAGAAYLAALPDAEALAANHPSDLNRRRDLALFYRRLGDVDVACGRLDQARPWFERALAIAQVLADATTAVGLWTIDLAVAHERLGDLELRTGSFARGEASHQRALGLRQELVDDAPADRTRVRELAVSHAKLADAALWRGHLADAFERGRRALELRLGLAEADRSNANWQRDVYTSHVRLADIAIAAGEPLPAAQHAYQARMIIEPLAEADPDNALRQRDLAIACQLQGRVAIAGQRESEALAHLARSLSIMGRLAAREPDRLEWQRGMFVTHMTLAGLAMSLHAFDEACTQMDLAQPLIERLAAADPRNIEWQRNLFQTYGRLGSLAARADDRDRACDWFRRALAVAKPPIDDGPMNAEWERDRIGMNLDLARITPTPEAHAHLAQAATLWRQLQAQGSLAHDAQFQAMGRELAARGLI